MDIRYGDTFVHQGSYWSTNNCRAGFDGVNLCVSMQQGLVQVLGKATGQHVINFNIQQQIGTATCLVSRQLYQQGLYAMLCFVLIQCI